METKELMIGDWVLYMGFAHRVTAVDDMVKIGSQWQPIAHFEPIPLTTKMLEKNGFRYYGYNWAYGEFVFAAYGKYLIGSVCCETFVIKNVHELQHALRLCGLNDLADNFKIE